MFVFFTVSSFKHYMIINFNKFRLINDMIKLILICIYILQERVMKCIEMFQQLESSDTASAEDSQCLSNINAASATTSSSLANSSNNSNSPEAKRIKPNKTNEA